MSKVVENLNSKFKISSKKSIWAFSIVCHIAVLVILSLLLIAKPVYATYDMPNVLQNEKIQYHIEFIQPHKKLRKKVRSRLFAYKNTQIKVIEPKVADIFAKASATPKIEDLWVYPLEEVTAKKFKQNLPTFVPTLAYDKTSTVRLFAPSRNKINQNQKMAKTSRQFLEPKRAIKRKKQVTVVDKIIPPRPIFAPKPIYPRRAQRLKIQGKVVLRLEVLPSGLPGQINFIRPSSYQILNKCAIKTLKKWRFSPAKRGKKNISAWIEIPLKFYLTNTHSF